MAVSLNLEDRPDLWGGSRAYVVRLDGIVTGSPGQIKG